MPSPAFALAASPSPLRLPTPSISPRRRPPPRASPRCASSQPRPSTPRQLIEEFWALSNAGAFSATTRLFSPSAVYVDTLYASPFSGRAAIARHLADMESAIPRGLVFVLDDLAPADASVGARWHVETQAGNSVPFSRGASMYKVEPADDDVGGMWITEAWDFVETPFKVAGLVLPMLKLFSFVSKMGTGD